MKKFHPEAKPPTHGSEHAAGYDLYCVGGVQGMDPGQLKIVEDKLPHWPAAQDDLDSGNFALYPGKGHLFRTGLAMAIEPGHACYFWDRSGMGAFKEVHRLAGVIDEDYRGEWLVKLINHSDQIVRIKPGDKIVQGIFQERIECEFSLVAELPESTRGAGGFGSTGT